MSKSNRFLVSYILDNDPKTGEVASDKESLTPAEALDLLTSQDRSLRREQLTDVRVQPLQGRGDNNHEPGHNLQHGDL